MRGTLRVLEHRLLVYRRTWRGSIFTSFLAPVLFLAAMGMGLGTFVNQSNPAALGGVSYLVFLAPGLLASQAMQTATGKSMYPVLSALLWQRTYLAMITTPILTWNIVIGQLLWLVFRLFVVSTSFVIVMVLLGATNVPAGIAMIPVAILTGLAFAMPITAYAATRRSDTSFSVVNRFVIIPLSIFSGTFFPITQLPLFLQAIAVVTPLWNGVALARALALGTFDPLLAAFNLLVIFAWVGAGTAAALFTFRRRLVQ